MSSLEKCLLMSSAHFLILFFSLLNCVSCLHSLEITPLLVASFYCFIFTHMPLYCFQEHMIWRASNEMTDGV